MDFNKSVLRKLTLVLLLFYGISIQAEVSPEAGKTLFTTNCAACHAKNMKTALTGPALGGVESRWDSKENLYAWIRNSQAMIKKGHPRSVELWNQYKPTVMTAFPNLTDDEIASMLVYIQGVTDGTYPPKTGSPVGTAATPEVKKDNTWFYAGIAIFLALLSYMLSLIIGNLNKLAAAQVGQVYHEKTLWEKLTSKGMVSFLIFAGIILGGYTTVTRAVDLGRQQGYAPDQPIKFSHATHAGLNKIDCQYCHDGARRSKQSVIPAANTCMNCHKAIKVGSKYGTAEISKIFASIGFNPITNTYIENYDSWPQDSIKAVFSQWIEQEYKTANDLTALDEKGLSTVRNQWKDIVSSLTSEVDDKIQGPIEWVRIHNLPDHAYFNHAQHVAVGKIACQTCHGPVEKMEVLAQQSPLSMGWCINCHRQTEVKFKDNPYYSSYTSLHEELKSGKRDKVTVADIGGLECQKCHY
ncbi:MAG: c-type cytochrome [Saprospiraceae bacterium]|nr:c-type cytochrome [Saprospiraceae bacterium]